MWNIAKWPVMLVVVILMFAVLFHAAPNVKLHGFKWVTPGAVLALVVWIVASVIFAFYVTNFGSYDKTYGALGGVVILLIWMWLTNSRCCWGWSSTRSASARASSRRASRGPIARSSSSRATSRRSRRRPSGAAEPPARVRPRGRAGIGRAMLGVENLAALAGRRSEKWDHPPGVLASTVAEMDFPLAPPVAAALHAAVDRHDLGYAPLAPRGCPRRSPASRAAVRLGRSTPSRSRSCPT